MIKILTIFSLLQMSVTSLASCLSTEQLNTLAQAERTYLLEKVPPYFKHQLQKGHIALQIESVESEACQAKVTITLPQSDIDQATTVLDVQPAKKIMLAAQGQALPNQVTNHAIFSLEQPTLNIKETDIWQTAPLGKLRASVELMYALLTQHYAVVSPNQTNTTPWPDHTKQKIVKDCTNKQTSEACHCLANAYEKVISANQMAYIEYIRTNPYALATGVNQAFEAVKEKATQACKA